MKHTLAIVATLLFLAGCRSTMDYSIPDRNTRVREFVRHAIASNEFPGITYLVLTRDSVLFDGSMGWADIEGKRPVTPSTTMMIYSMSKTITAAGVLRLVEEGKVGLDDPVSRFFPDHPYGNALTVRHLLAQMSGIPNPIPLSWVHLASEHGHFDEPAALRAVLAENPELKSAPGDHYNYSNISYWLLGRVVEKASGTSYEEYMRRQVVQPLGLSPAELNFVIPAAEHHAKGYLPKWSFFNLIKSFMIDSRFVGEYEDGWLHIEDHYLNGPAFGGIVASGRGIGVFLQDMLADSSRLFSSATRALFFRQQQNNAGKLVPMTLGWHVGSLDSVRYYFKEGGGGGFHSEMRIYPSLGIASVAIANSASFDAPGFLNSADPEFLKR